MMYSGHGRTLPCFEKGKKAIENLEKRFFPEKHCLTVRSPMFNTHGTIRGT